MFFQKRAVWFSIMTFGLTVFLPPILLFSINLSLMHKLIVACRDRIHLLNNISSRRMPVKTSDIKSAKDLTVISFITLIIAFPTLLWAPTLIIQSILYFIPLNINSCVSNNSPQMPSNAQKC